MPTAGGRADQFVPARTSGVDRAESPRTVIIDYPAPNVAKEMQVGHLRSTVIGDVAVRVLEWRGRHVIKANHLGDFFGRRPLRYSVDSSFGTKAEGTLAERPIGRVSVDGCGRNVALPRQLLCQWRSRVVAW